MLVFSADPLRGRIIQKVLMRSRVEPLLLQTIKQVREAVSQRTPDIAIFDTAGCFREEINYLANLCGTLTQTAVILLGDGLVLEKVEGSATRRDLRLSDPLDPDLIVQKVEELLSLKVEEKRSGDDSLEDTLKGFLRLR